MEPVEKRLIVLFMICNQGMKVLNLRNHIERYLRFMRKITKILMNTYNLQ